MLVEVREQLKGEGLPTYDYGNFRPYRPGKDNPPTAWESYDAHPRLLTNYPALQGRLAVLSEAYVYRSWPDRIADTRRFVLACLEWLAAHRAEVEQVRLQAHLGWAREWTQGTPSLPLTAVFREVERYPFDWVEPIRDETGRLVGEKSRTRLELPAFVAFEGRDLVAVPKGYLIHPAYADRLRTRLEAHGIQVLPGAARPREISLLHFHETGREVSKGAYQGIFTLKLKGTWRAEAPAQKYFTPWSVEELDHALYVPATQSRLVFYLLDPRSDDGFVFWGLFHPSLLRGEGMWGEPPRFPILALGQPDAAPSSAQPPPGPERAE
jgi:hypothetical protein